MKSSEGSLRGRLALLSSVERAYVLRAVLTADWDWTVGASIQCENSSTVRDALASIRGAGRGALGASLQWLTAPITEMRRRGEAAYRGPMVSRPVAFLQALGQFGESGVLVEESTDACSTPE